ncbi:MAG: hypothetical protein BWY94_01982 [Actinobacteria bacterium ADurb.BinA094]|nr:MAG: hypothetical protein BWY94_01982 [Actinobacteria bacterium ADurb.BinA094]
MPTSAAPSGKTTITGTAMVWSTSTNMLRGSRHVRHNMQPCTAKPNAQSSRKPGSRRSVARTRRQSAATITDIAMVATPMDTPGPPWWMRNAAAMLPPIAPGTVP